jgi:nucleotide-binding universal stress UspA family protein
MGLIVVGVDGSEASKEALRWAIREAELRHATLRAVHAWLYPAVLTGGFVPPDALDWNVLRSDAEEALHATLREVAGEDPRANIERIVVDGPAARALVEAAKDADLLVVGSRGHSGFTGLLLGSVSQQCAHHAPCAVVIMRKQEDSEQA